MERTEPSGPELARAVRAMLPLARHESFDGMAELYTPDDADLSQCGALLSLTAPFGECLAALEIDAVREILILMDDLLTFPEGRDQVGSLRNSVLSCFLESVLPLPEELRDLVPLGPNIRAFAERHDPYWLGLPGTPKRPLWRRLLSRDRRARAK